MIREGDARAYRPRWRVGRGGLLALPAVAPAGRTSPYSRPSRPPPPIQHGHRRGVRAAPPGIAPVCRIPRRRREESRRPVIPRVARRRGSRPLAQKRQASRIVPLHNGCFGRRFRAGSTVRCGCKLIDRGNRRWAVRGCHRTMPCGGRSSGQTTIVGHQDATAVSGGGCPWPILPLVGRRAEWTGDRRGRSCDGYGDYWVL